MILPTHPKLKTAIVCTVGPASWDEASLTAMITAGMSVARLNFSHGTHEEHRMITERVRAVAAGLGRNVWVMQDLQGPKVRVGELPEPGVELVMGAEVVFSTASVPAKGAIPVDYELLHEDVGVGDTIMLGDGEMSCRVTEVRGREVKAVVTAPGLLRKHKGLAVPGVQLQAAAITPKDVEDLRFGLTLGVELVALSFVRSAADVDKLRAMMAMERKQLGVGAVMPAVVAKLEKYEAVEAMGEVVGAADVVMVARGDLAVDVAQERVPVIQKEVVAMCRQLGKPVIVATQMLESMMGSPRPTRAELTDVANAVWDGATGVMLSGESAFGKYPVLAVETMAAIVAEAEKSRFYRWVG